MLHDIRHNSPTTVAETARRLEIPPKTVYHHAGRLVRQGYVEERTLGRRRFLFYGPVPDGWEQRMLLADPDLADLYETVARNPGIPQGAVVSLFGRTGWKRSTVQHRLARLVAAGVLVRRGSRGRHLYAAPPEALLPRPDR